MVSSKLKRLSRIALMGWMSGNLSVAPFEEGLWLVYVGQEGIGRISGIYQLDLDLDDATGGSSYQAEEELVQGQPLASSCPGLRTTWGYSEPRRIATQNAEIELERARHATTTAAQAVLNGQLHLADWFRFFRS